jgi:hypothetical protein
VKAHVSVLLGVLALVQMGRYWLGRYELVFSTQGTVDGATYTDVNVQLRAIYLLMMIAVFAFGLFIANIWRRGWVLPGMAVGCGHWWPCWRGDGASVRAALPGAAHRVIGGAALHRQQHRGHALGLRVGERRGASPTTGRATSTPPPSTRTSGTMRNVRLWDTGTVQDSFSRRQEIRPYYGITDVDVDRYVIDGELTEVMVAARDLNTDGIQRPSWEATHLIYTNGYGVVAATANDKTASGDPRLVARDIPVTTTNGMPEVEQPRLYFGENKSGYVIVNTDVRDPERQQRGDEDRGQPLRRRRWHRTRRRAGWVLAQGGVLVALRRHRPARVGQHPARLEGDDRARRHRSAEEGGAVPRLRARPVRGGGPRVVSSTWSTATPPRATSRTPSGPTPVGSAPNRACSAGRSTTCATR